MLGPVAATEKKPAAPEIIQKTDPALALTVFYPNKPHEVRFRWRLSWHRLKLTPYVGQRLDHTQTVAGLKLTVATTYGTFTSAPVLVVADGRLLNSAERLDWAAATSLSGDTEETEIEGVELVRGLADAQEAYITVLFPGEQAPLDRISFRLSPEQTADCRLIVAKYDELTGGGKR